MGLTETTGELPNGTVVLGKYRIDGVLGRGGMGIVYAAHHAFMDQRVALKLLLPQALTGADAIPRFITEARHAAKIPGENVCRILDVGLLESGLPYIAMEYLEGRSLEAVARERGAIDAGDAARWILQSLAAVAHAHARGIVHRDLKPSNLFLATMEDGVTVTKVLDFGISRSAASAQHNLTSTNGMLGSPGYISPEHIRSSKALDPRSDIWSVGVVLYELLAKTAPFQGETAGEIFAAVLEKEPAPLGSLRAAVPEGLSALVHRCLAKNPDRRFQTVAELADALAPFAGPDGPLLAERVRKALASPTGRGASLSLSDASEASSSGPYDASRISAVPPSRPGAGGQASLVAAITGRPWSQTTVTVARHRSRALGVSAGAVGALLTVVIVAIGVTHFVRRADAPATGASSPTPQEQTPGAASSPSAENPAPPQTGAGPKATDQPVEAVPPRPPATASASPTPAPSHRPSRQPSPGARPNGGGQPPFVLSPSRN